FNMADSTEPNLPDSQESFSEFWCSSLQTNDFPNIVIDESALPATSNWQTYTTMAPVCSLLDIGAQINHGDDTGLFDFNCSQHSADDLFDQSLPSTQASITCHTSVGAQQECSISQNTLLVQKIETPSIISILPKFSEFPGVYNFQVDFGKKTDGAPKSAPYTYSHRLHKLYVKMNENCPIRFTCSLSPPTGCIIRAIPVFERANNVTEMVTRCSLHSNENLSENVAPKSHLIRVEANHHVTYTLTSDGRESVCTSYEGPQAGCEYVAVLYKYMCLSSCSSAGGINRRPLLTVFNLEKKCGELLGRRVVSTRICTCPGRDRTQEEEKKGVLENKKSSKRPLLPKKDNLNIDKGESEVYSLTIIGKRKFEKVKEYKEALDLMDFVQPEVKKACCDKNQM
uniref:Cellular tumor antigen p53 n=1 Tax=Ciona savignyi TaxID=51511 RepID=H2ZGE3_CIOSA